VVAETRSGRLSTFDTVPTLTPARRATSEIDARRRTAVVLGMSPLLGLVVTATVPADDDGR
jgi:hypothetical protein